MDLTQLSNTFSVFSEPTRLRALMVLRTYELSVQELTFVLQVSQSRVSSHLGRLKEVGLIRDRHVGTSTLWRYVVPENDDMDGPHNVWEFMRMSLGSDEAHSADLGRAVAVIHARHQGKSALDHWAGEMEKHYSPGRTWEALANALCGLANLGDVVDLGGGDGAVAQMLAPHARRYTLVDHSDAMLGAAKRRLHKMRQVRLLNQDVHALDLPAHSADLVLLFNLLTDVDDPQAVLQQAARLLRAKGRVVVVTLGNHRHHGAMEEWGHKHPGFAPASLATMLRKAGLDVSSCAITSRERRTPRFSVVTAFAQARTTS